MANPWLSVPLDDYEGHMRAAGVAQLDVLANLFAEALATCRPASVAILGVAGGNGLAAIDPAVTTRVVGVDINPRYIAATKERFAHIAGLDLRCADLAQRRVELEPVELVHAAPIFGHAGAARCLDNAIGMMAPAGHLSVVLQLPSDVERDVSPSGFAAIQNLRDDFALIDPREFVEDLAARGCQLVNERTRALPGGKAFWMGMFQSSSGGRALSPANVRQA